MMKEVCLNSLLLWSSPCGIRMQIGNLNKISCTWNLPFYFGQVFGEVNFFYLGSREKIPMIGDSHPVTNIYFCWIHGLSLWSKSQPYFSIWCHIAQTIDFWIHLGFITYDFRYLSMAHEKKLTSPWILCICSSSFCQVQQSAEEHQVNYWMALNFSQVVLM